MPMFQVRPDLFPEGFLTLDEIELWGRYTEYLDKQSKKAKRRTMK